jgi:hypothetical protein
MNNLFGFLNQGWVGVIVGIVGVIIAIITYKRSMIGGRLVYQWNSLNIIGKNEKTPDEIEIYYKGKKVPRIIKTRIILWNSGNKTVDGERIVKNDQLRLEFGNNEEIIRAYVQKKTREVNDFGITLDNENKNIIKFSFEFLDPKDGAVIEILHTDNKRYPDVKGSIKGLPKGLLYWGSKSRTRGEFSKKIMGIDITKMVKSKIIMLLMFTFGLGALIVGLIPIFSDDIALKLSSKSKDNINLKFYQWIFVGILYSGFPTLVFWSRRKRYPKTLDPERIESDFILDEQINKI